MFNQDRIAEFVELATAFKDPKILNTMAEFKELIAKAEALRKENDKISVANQFSENELVKTKAEIAKAWQEIEVERAKVAYALDDAHRASQEANKALVAAQREKDSQDALRASVERSKALAEAELAKVTKAVEKNEALTVELEAKLTNLKSLVA